MCIWVNPNSTHRLMCVWINSPYFRIILIVNDVKFTHVRIKDASLLRVNQRNSDLRLPFSVFLVV